MDGALGSRGAWLLEPYADQPESRGLNTEDPADIRKTAELAIEHGYQLCIHAIGDRANREVLDIYERVFREHPEKKDLRWRVEHAQHLSAADIPRFGKLGVVAAMQGIHCTSDGPYVILRLGRSGLKKGPTCGRSSCNRARWWERNGRAGRRRQPAGVVLCLGEPQAEGRFGVLPGQRMSREEALRSYTWNNAYAAFEEKLKGSLEPGKLADITVLSRDIMTIPEDEIAATDVVYTIVGGKVAYERRARH